MTKNSSKRVKALRAGANVALIAPSGILPDKTHVEQARENTRSLGWTPIVGDNVASLHGYLAGTDEQRLADLNRAIADDTVDATR